MNEINMMGTLVKLADLGVTGIKVQYEGSGDSGAIENVVYTTEKMDQDEEAAFDDINDIEVWGQDVSHLQELDSGLSSDIANFVEEQLLQDVENWWNDEGGYGAVCILVPSGAFTLLFDLTIPQAALSADGTSVKVLDYLVTQSAYARALIERGEDGGTNSNEAYALFRGMLSDAIALESTRYPEDNFVAV